MPRFEPEFTPRSVCYACLRPARVCYCGLIRRFDPGFDLVLLVHPREARNPVGTVRMAYLSAEGSRMIVGRGTELDHDPRILALVEDPWLFPAVLFPGSDAISIESLSEAPTRDEASWPGDGRRLALFVIDGTWNQAAGMVRQSALLHALPKIAFSPDRPSEYEFREQPRLYCLSTVEAVHTVVERLSRAGVIPMPEMRAHDAMLEVFRGLVRFQVGCEEARTAAAHAPKLLDIT